MTTNCPIFYCRRAHNEAPGEAVIHESEQVEIPRLPGAARPTVGVQISQADDDMAPRLNVGDYDFDTTNAARLLEELTVLVAQMRAAQADYDRGLVTA
ncbi:hypothetical protein [Actinoplanes rectilineatus]|uniref:hypothetical protein n=1 Tax=Actinoplanes rectilineatus TaxID=113571 RepID=UPI0005F2B10E|nr:hypothetical protein [Actinoplanes rectilineatus]